MVMSTAVKLQPDLILIDGSAYLFRAYHALPALTNSHGEPTGAVVGMVNMLRKLQQDIQFTYGAVVFDAPGPTFRDQIAPTYKAQRPPTPDDLIAQIQQLQDIIRALGWPLLSVTGVEADDVIGTLAIQGAQNGLKTLIVTGDKDFSQLVTQSIHLLDTMHDRYLDIDMVHQKFGVYPEQIIDLLSLMGDKSDNIPGIPGCGSVTAQKWLTKYKDLDNLISHADEITGKVGKALREN
ncbi:DNA polymerase I, partial [Achromatium sp. WMS3]